MSGADAGRSESWAVWDLNAHDPWGIQGPAFGPMPREQAERMVTEGAAQSVPRHYSAGPWPSAAASSPSSERGSAAVPLLLAVCLLLGLAGLAVIA